MTEGGPQGEAEQGEGQQQMDGEVEVTDGGAVNQSAGDHEPPGYRL